MTMMTKFVVVVAVVEYSNSCNTFYLDDKAAAAVVVVVVVVAYYVGVHWTDLSNMDLFVDCDVIETLIAVD